MTSKLSRTDVTQWSSPHVVKAPVVASAVPVLISTKATGLSVVVPSDTEEDNTEDEASAASTAQPAQDPPTVAKTPSPDDSDMPVDGTFTISLSYLKISC